MIKIKTTLVQVLTILTIISFATTAYASAVYLNNTTVKQAKTEWCWAASAENAIRWEMTPIRTQWDAVNRIKGNEITPYPNTGGMLWDIAAAAEYISNGTEDYRWTGDKKTFDYLFKEISDYSNQVILAAGYYNSMGIRTGGHAVTMYGADNYSMIIAYVDPWDNLRYQCTYTNFCNGIYNGRHYDGTVNNTEY